MNFLDLLLVVTIVFCASLLVMSIIYICIYSVELCYRRNSAQENLLEEELLSS
jgi:hypothetical protein|uniref:Uncharacterized protein n=1 Tax=viral metagenome TaxID=1070528 RepID=A0A6C0CI38_9ZZZZ